VSTVTKNLDDEAARLTQTAAQLVNQPLEHWLRESICQMAERTVNKAKVPLRRVSPWHPGAMQPTPDFNAPLEELAPRV
jgi:hypothetical protein